MTKIKDPKEGQAHAFFSVQTKNFTINGVRLMLADNGKLYAHMPVREYTYKGRKVREPYIEIHDLDYLEVLTVTAREVFAALG